MSTLHESVARRRSARYWLLQLALRRMGRRSRGAAVDIARMRRGLERGLTRLGPPRADIQISTRVVEGVSCLEHRGRDDASLAALYVHGGGYTLGSAEAYKGPVSRFCARLDCSMLVPDYRLAPEHPYPAAVDDLERVAGAMASSRSGRPWILMGDSAGGGLALALALRLRARQPSAAPAALVLFSPWVDLRCESASMSSQAEVDCIVQPHWLRAFARMYAGEHELASSQISPLLDDLGGLPPTLIEVGGLEVLRDDARALARALANESVPCHLHEDVHGIHVWQIYLPWLPEARASMTRVQAFLAKHAGIRVR